MARGLPRPQPTVGTERRAGGDDFATTAGNDIRARGVEQFITVWKKEKDRGPDKLLMGDEVAFSTPPVLDISRKPGFFSNVCAPTTSNLSSHPSLDHSGPLNSIHRRTLEVNYLPLFQDDDSPCRLKS